MMLCCRQQRCSLLDEIENENSTEAKKIVYWSKGFSGKAEDFYLLIIFLWCLVMYFSHSFFPLEQNKHIKWNCVERWERRATELEWPLKLKFLDTLFMFSTDLVLFLSIFVRFLSSARSTMLFTRVSCLLNVNQSSIWAARKKGDIGFWQSIIIVRIENRRKKSARSFSDFQSQLVICPHTQYSNERSHRQRTEKKTIIKNEVFCAIDSLPIATSKKERRRATPSFFIGE